MITVDQALKLLDEHKPDWGDEQLPLGKITGRRLAQDITAPYSHPKAAVSVCLLYTSPSPRDRG